MAKILYEAEEKLAMLLFSAVVIMVLVGAIGRTAGIPQTWSIDLAQATFAWCCVLGADITWKHHGHIVIDIVVEKLPDWLQTALSFIWHLAIAVFLGLLVWLGTKLTLINTQRELGDLGVSYAWVTASIPVGALLMLLTTLTHLSGFFRTRALTRPYGHDGEA